MSDFAKVDNNLARSQRGIGESTNIAQIAQSYGYTYDDKDYEMYNALLATICQCCIDNAKRTFAIDIPNEIRRIKQELEIKEKGLPIFWKAIKRDGVDYSKRINENIKCPMNEIYKLKIPRVDKNTKTIPLSAFFKKITGARTCHTNLKVEELIKQYGINVLETVGSDDSDDWILLRSDFDDLVRDLEKVKISKSYLSLCSWLIDRAFEITQQPTVPNKMIYKNKQALLRVLYESSPNNILEIFSNEPMDE